MKMYRVSDWEVGIKTREVVKTSDKSIWFKKEVYGKDRIDRELRNTSYYHWFETFHEAKDWMIEKYEKQIESNHAKLERSKYNLNLIRRMSIEDN